MSNKNIFFETIFDYQIEILTIGHFNKKYPTLILLHEGLGSVSMWRNIPELVHQNTKLNVLAYSRPGYGNSSKIPLPRPLDYMSQEATLILPELISKLNLKKVILIGHSDGASIAAIHASSKGRNAILGTVLIAPHFFAESISISAIKKTTKKYEFGNLKERLQKYHKNVDIAFYGWSRAWLDPRFEDWDISSVIENIKCPILVIQGDNDPYGTLLQVQTLEKNSKTPLQKLIINECGHNPFVEKFEIVINSINSFINTIDNYSQKV